MDLIIFYISIIFVNLLILLNLNKIAKFIDVYDKPDNQKISQKKYPVVRRFNFISSFNFVLHL